MIMLVLQYKILLLGYGSDEFEEFETIGVDAFAGASHILSFSPDFANEHGYLIGLQVEQESPETYVSKYNGSNEDGMLSLLLRITFDVN